MAAVQPVNKCEEVEEVKFTVTLENMESFKAFESNVIFVRGNPWVISFEKKKNVKNQDQDVLSVWLIPKVLNPVADWAIVGSFTFELHQSEFNGRSLRWDAKECVFDSELFRWGWSSAVTWDTLLNPTNGYVHNNKCRFVVTIKASPLYDTNNNNRMEFTQEKQCCDSSSNGIFRMKIHNLQDFSDILSPIFNLNNFPLRLLIVRKQSDGTKENSIEVNLHNRSMASGNTVANCNLNVTCSLVSFDPNINSIESKTEHQLKRPFEKHFATLQSISCNELFDPQKKFVENHSFIIEVKMRVINATGSDLAKCMCGAVKLVCPICFENLTNRPISGLSCGHLFCTECLEKSIRQHEICPTCREPATQ